TQKDKKYWLWKEQAIQAHLVDLADYGFAENPEYIFNSPNMAKHRKLVRPAVALALVKARKLLPKGYNFKIYDAWRSWALQKNAAAYIKKKSLRRIQSGKKNRWTNFFGKWRPRYALFPN